HGQPLERVLSCSRERSSIVQPHGPLACVHRQAGKGGMTIELHTRRDFTLEAFRRVAWGCEGVRLVPAAIARIGECRSAFLRLLDLEPDLVIYGVTTGYGQHASRRLSAEERKAHARLPPYGSATAFGPPAPQRVARGIVFARLANYVEGHG